MERKIKFQPKVIDKDTEGKSEPLCSHKNAVDSVVVQTEQLLDQINNPVFVKFEKCKIVFIKNTSFWRNGATVIKVIFQFFARM